MKLRERRIGNEKNGLVMLNTESSLLYYDHDYDDATIRLYTLLHLL